MSIGFFAVYLAGCALIGWSARPSWSARLLGLSGMVLATWGFALMWEN